MAEFGMTADGKPLHPGRILLVQAMEPLGISRNQLARDIDVPVGRISDITNGKRGITADTALRLGRYFGTGPELWMRLQAEYDLHVARITTWPAVEGRVRTLETQDSQTVPAPAPATPPQSAVETADPDNDELEAEVYSLPGDVEAEDDTEIWSPAALPENGANDDETISNSEEPIREARSDNPPLASAAVISENGTANVPADSTVEEDIGIPPAPRGTTTPA